MKWLLSTLVLLFSIAPVSAQNAETPKLVQFHMAILKRNPNQATQSSSDMSRVRDNHLAYAQSLLKSGKAIIAGPIKDDKDLAGIYIFRAANADEAKSWVMADPLVTSAIVIPEMHPWWSEDVMKKIETVAKFETVYLAFLTRGENWTPQSTPETEQLQKDHLANIRRLNAMKKLVVAGPFGDEGQLRGIFVFRVASLEEAQQLADTDPAVKAGRLKLEIHPWAVPEGILP